MNIALTGMPACGKTTAARELVKLLIGYRVIDTDKKIIEIENRSINDIFNNNGEEYFREIETEVLENILKEDNQIISTGGGIVKCEKNLELLKEYTKVIYLKADVETLAQRAIKDSSRPLLKDCDIKNKLEQLLEERKEKYEQAHYIIETEMKSAKEIAREIAERINGNIRNKNQCTR